MLAAASEAQLEHTAVFRFSTMIDVKGGGGWACPRYLGMLASTAPHLSDMEFVVNLTCVLPGGDLLGITRSACVNASAALTRDAPLHGFFMAGRQVRLCPMLCIDNHDQGARRGAVPAEVLELSRVLATQLCSQRASPFRACPGACAGAG